MKSQILLVVIDNTRQNIYEVFLKFEQVNYQIVSSLRELVRCAAKEPYSGILIDMPVMVRASNYDKKLAEDALNALPSARINISRADSSILVLPIGENNDLPHSAHDFVHYCCNMSPKLVFIRNRIPLHINALLSTKPDMSDAVKTACIDFSEGGCFLFTTDDSLIPENVVWIKLIALEDQTTIEGMICWKQDWGIESKIPGIGIRFDILTSSQQSEILAVISKKRVSMGLQATMI